MRPSRTDVFPMLVIMAGGAIGALLTLSPVLLFGPIDDVPAPVQPVLSPPEEATVWVRPLAGRAVPILSPDGTSIVYEDGNGNVYRVNSGVSPGEQRIAYRSKTSVEETAEPLWVIDGVPIGTSRSILESLEAENVEAIEVLKADAAVRLYGQEASSGVILITLKGTSSRR